MLGFVFDQAEHGNEEQLWRLLSFLARYAHQPVDVLLRLTIPELTMFAKATGRLLEEEAKSIKGETDG